MYDSNASQCVYSLSLFSLYLLIIYIYIFMYIFSAYCCNNMSLLLHIQSCMWQINLLLKPWLCNVSMGVWLKKTVFRSEAIQSEANDIKMPKRIEKEPAETLQKAFIQMLSFWLILTKKLQLSVVGPSNTADCRLRKSMPDSDSYWCESGEIPMLHWWTAEIATYYLLWTMLSNSVV